MPFQITKTKPELLPVDAVLQFKCGRMPESLIKRLHNRGNTAQDANCIFILPRKDGQRRLVRYVRDTAKADKGTIAAIYHDVLEEASKRGWKSIAIPLCPSALPPQEVYQIACSAIREALNEYDYDVFLVVDNKSQILPKTSLLTRIRDFVDERFVEPGMQSAGLSYNTRLEDESPNVGGGAPRAKRARNWPRASASEDLFRPKQKHVEAELELRAVVEKPKPHDFKSIPGEIVLTDSDAALSYESGKNRRESAFIDDQCDLSGLRELEKRESETVPEADAGKDTYDTYDSFFSGDFTVSTEDAPAAPSHTLSSSSFYVPDRFDPATATIRLDESFSEAVLRLIDQKGMSDPECYSRANLSRAVFNKLKQSAINPEKAVYKPSKSTALALAVALELGLDEANDLLKKAGYTLSHSSKGDIIVEYFLANRLYDIFELNEVLFKFGEPLLGSL